MMLTPDEYMALMRLIESERESEGSSLSQREESITKPKRRRSKKQRASDKRSSDAFRRANELGRKKDGSFKAGYDQARIASTAQRLKKKM
ncbi:MAG: hypothetical protein [Circular genetic element sp.]|jgi:hypothetical protein|nr:MAG: hypothetical protein [Circular genetic element sp.]